MPAATQKQLRLIARLAAENGLEAPAPATIAEASAAIDQLKRYGQTPEGTRREIERLLAEDRDLRYFDASPENLVRASSAGEGIRKFNARAQRAAQHDAAYADAVRLAIELALPRMDGRDLLYTAQALRLCPVR